MILKHWTFAAVLPELMLFYIKMFCCFVKVPKRKKIFDCECRTRHPWSLFMSLFARGLTCLRNESSHRHLAAGFERVFCLPTNPQHSSNSQHVLPDATQDCDGCLWCTFWSFFLEAAETLVSNGAKQPSTCRSQQISCFDKVNNSYISCSLVSLRLYLLCCKYSTDATAAFSFCVIFLECFWLKANRKKRRIKRRANSWVTNTIMKLWSYISLF